MKTVNEERVLCSFTVFYVHSKFRGKSYVFLVRQNVVPGQTPKHWIRTKPMDRSELETMLYFFIGEGPDCARGEARGGHTGGREAA